MLIFSVSFQFYRMISEENPLNRASQQAAKQQFRIECPGAPSTNSGGLPGNLGALIGNRGASSDPACTPQAGPVKPARRPTLNPQVAGSSPGLGATRVASPPLTAGKPRGKSSCQAACCEQARRPGTKNLVTLLDLCVSSLRRGHANLLCIVPILSDDLRGESNYFGFRDIRLAMAKGASQRRQSLDARSQA